MEFFHSRQKDFQFVVFLPLPSRSSTSIFFLRYSKIGFALLACWGMAIFGYVAFRVISRSANQTGTLTHGRGYPPPAGIPGGDLGGQT